MPKFTEQTFILKVKGDKDAQEICIQALIDEQHENYIGKFSLREAIETDEGTDYVTYKEGKTA
jgi:hypothetical protein